MEPILDLHMHSIYSDGTLTPYELCAEAAEKGLSLIALTDHDSIDGLEEMIQAAQSNGIKCIPGVEISVVYEGREIHLLTYGVRGDDALLNGILKRNQAIRETHNSALITFVATQDTRIAFEDYLQYERNPKLGGWKAVNYLVEKKVAENVNAFFNWIDQFGVQLTFDPIEDILPMLKKQGYTVVLAHPPAYFSGELLPTKLLDHWVKMGIAGIECYSPYFKMNSQSQYYIDYCKANQLIVTAGSDYHGAFITTRQMGAPQITGDMVTYTRLLEMAK